jgi:hypothetical protein
MQKNSLKQLMLVVALFTMQAVFGTNVRGGLYIIGGKLVYLHPNR